MWVQTFGPATRSIEKVANLANGILKETEVWKKEKRVIGVVNRRGRNIGDMILKRRKFALQDGRCITKGTTRCTPVLKEGEKGSKV